MPSITGVELAVGQRIEFFNPAQDRFVGAIVDVGPHAVYVKDARVYRKADAGTRRESFVKGGITTVRLDSTYFQGIRVIDGERA